MNEIEFSKLKQVWLIISMKHGAPSWKCIVYWTLGVTMLCPFFEWYPDNFLLGKLPPSWLGLGLGLGLVLGWVRAIFFEGNCRRTSLNISRTKKKWKNTLNVDKSCTYLQTFEYSRTLNMPRIMNISEFQLCQGL